MSLWWPMPSFMVLHPGAVDWIWRTPTDGTNSSSRPVRLVKSWTLCQQNAGQDQIHAGSFSSSSPGCAGRPQKHLQSEAHFIKLLHRSLQEVLPAWGHQTVEFVSLTVISLLIIYLCILSPHYNTVIYNNNNLVPSSIVIVNNVDCIYCGHYFILILN